MTWWHLQSQKIRWPRGGHLGPYGPSRVLATNRYFCRSHLVLGPPRIYLGLLDCLEPISGALEGPYMHIGHQVGILPCPGRGSLLVTFGSFFDIAIWSVPRIPPRSYDPGNRYQTLRACNYDPFRVGWVTFGPPRSLYSQKFGPRWHIIGVEGSF